MDPLEAQWPQSINRGKAQNQYPQPQGPPGTDRRKNPHEGQNEKASLEGSSQPRMPRPGQLAGNSWGHTLTSPNSPKYSLIFSSVASGFRPPTKIFFTGSFFMAMAFLGSMTRPSSLCSFWSRTCSNRKESSSQWDDPAQSPSVGDIKLKIQVNKMCLIPSKLYLQSDLPTQSSPNFKNSCFPYKSLLNTSTFCPCCTVAPFPAQLQ